VSTVRLTATLTTIVPWLDELLATDATPDYGGAMNGLQFAHAGPVVRVAAAVDASLRSVEDAVACGANLLIVHHGLFWSGAQPIRGSLHRKHKLLFDHDIAVYSSHLPLDRHPTLGNNVLLARALQLTPSSVWLPYKGVAIGVTATTDQRTRDLAQRVRDFSALHGHHAAITPHSAERQSRHVAICSGGGASTESIQEALALGADTLIVGEGPHHTAIAAEDANLVVMYAGHYATETLGVHALAEAVGQRWGLPWSFLPAPSGL
jgi:dinuclear metal center YbgI/SA1388 family protein